MLSGIVTTVFTAIPGLYMVWALRVRIAAMDQPAG